ncbi:MAG TPA: FAD-binding oxidoreductase [Chthoniobacterales bacterium]|nr:FAD-binding oxidoreductase [Chthoniobacterales bacterium]
MRSKTMEISGWGRYPRGVSRVVRPERMKEAVPPREGQVIARGQGRSYGQAAMSADGSVMLTERLNRFLDFDDRPGVLRAEAGSTIAEVLEAFVPRGWFPAVTPGTKFVSLGGCVAADVHGKNHHRVGTFGNHVEEIELVLADGQRKRCSPQQEKELFWATVGGMGLTGIITEIALRLIPIETASVIAQHHPARNLDESLELLEKREFDDEYTVAWLDCLARGESFGRSVLMRGHHAKISELPAEVKKPLEWESAQPRNIPASFPGWFLKPWGVSLFNRLYYFAQSKKKGPFVSSCEKFFYPLDRLGNWNRLYGRRGFVQYQCVVPSVHARRGLRLILEELARSGRASFLTVLKRFGAEGQGLLSFPTEGFTLTLDLPMTDSGLFPFLDRLDEIVLEHGGRIYLAKDARVKGETFRAMYPRFAEWQLIKAAVDLSNCFSSDLARLLAMGGAPT